MILSHVTESGHGHIALPVDGTYARAADGQPASLRRGSDYPVTATCKICRQPIGLTKMLQVEWRHLNVIRAVNGGGAR